MTRPTRSALLSMSVWLLSLPIGCASGPVLELDELEPGTRLVLETDQWFHIFPGQPDAPVVRSSFTGSLLRPDDLGPGYWVDLEDGEDPCAQIAPDATASLAHLPAEVDPGGVRPIAYGLTFRDSCHRPHVAIDAFDGKVFEPGARLDLTLSTSASSWSPSFTNPFQERNLVRLDDRPARAGDTVRWRWSVEGEAPRFLSGQGPGTSTTLMMALAGQPSVEVLVTWVGNELHVALPDEVTGLATLKIAYADFEPSPNGAGFSASASGPGLHLTQPVEDCPVASCELRVGVVLPPVELEIMPADAP